MKRRSFIEMSATAAAAAPAAAVANGAPNPLLKYLCSPDDVPRDLSEPSPPAKSYNIDLYVPPVMQEVTTNFEDMSPPPVPDAHQLWKDFVPQKLYEIHEVQLDNWVYANDAVYQAGSYSWGYRDGSSPDSEAGTPGPVYKAWYGQPLLTRRYNDLPPVGQGAVKWALPSTTSHLHNGHTASESDGNPQDWIDSGEYWDHHYCNFPSGWTEVADDAPDREAQLEQVNREKLNSLWYHDHRLDFTAANVYAGLAGFYFLFDEQDTGFENPNAEETAFLENLYGEDYEKKYGVRYDPDKVWGFPSGDFDVPLMLNDIMFSQPKDPKGKPDGTAQVRWDAWNTDGILGDMYTVNRRIRPRFKVKSRRYRLRLYNGGPSRFYQMALYKVNKEEPSNPTMLEFTIVTGDGNILPLPIKVNHVYLSVAQRVDIIVDFAQQPSDEDPDIVPLETGDEVVLVNLLDQINGKGPASPRPLPIQPGPEGDFGVVPDTIDGVTPLIGTPAQGVMKFIIEEKVPDHSKKFDSKTRFRPYPTVDLREVRQERLWTFDYDGGLWTINGRIMEPNRIDAGIAKNSAEVWTFRNTGNEWSHPIHCHFTEFMMLEVNGRPFGARYLDTTSDPETGTVTYEGTDGESGPITVYKGGVRRDVATILPYDEIRLFLRFKDFLGKHVMHCHNVVHEDHAMMIRWDMLPEGIESFGVGVGDGEPKEVTEVYGNPTDYPYPDPRPAPVKDHLEERPGQATFQSG